MLAVAHSVLAVVLMLLRRERIFLITFLDMIIILTVISIGIALWTRLAR